MSSLSVSKTESGFWSQIIKGVLVATSISLIAILAFGVLLKYVAVPTEYIMPINQVIKVVSIFFGVLKGLSNSSQKGLFKGMMIGLIYTILAYVLFSALTQNFVFNLSNLNDLAFGALLGAISGIIVVNAKR